jgi:hypothetical protein
MVTVAFGEPTAWAMSSSSGAAQVFPRERPHNDSGSAAGAARPLQPGVGQWHASASSRPGRELLMAGAAESTAREGAGRTH